jgi:ATP-dependent Zn protease
MTKRSKLRLLNDPRHTAYHEAGHAVIGRVLTLLSGGATIEPDYEAESAGCAITENPHACERAWEKRGKVRYSLDVALHAQIITSMAGAEAEIVLLGQTDGGAGHDRLKIGIMAQNLSIPLEHFWERTEPRLRAFTRRLVLRHREPIERVAAALLEKKTLSGAELDKLVGRSVDDVKAKPSSRPAGEVVAFGRGA